MLPNIIKNLSLGTESKRVVKVIDPDKVFSHKHKKSNNASVKNGNIENIGYRIDRRSLAVFRANRSCVGCGLTISFAAVTTNKFGHNILNFWGTTEDGKHVLITKDHIKPKSKGGAKNLSNLQTMCYKCNLKRLILMRLYLRKSK